MSISDNLQKVFTDTSNIPLKKLNDKDNERYINNLKNHNFENYKPIRGESKSGRYNYTKAKFKASQGERIKKLIIPSNIIDIYTRLQILLPLELSGTTDSFTQASNLIDEIYKRGEVQNEQ